MFPRLPFPSLRCQYASVFVNGKLARTKGPTTKFQSQSDSDDIISAISSMAEAYTMERIPLIRPPPPPSTHPGSPEPLMYILFLSLSIQPFFDKSYLKLFKMLCEEELIINRAKTADHALELLAQTTFLVILVTDEGITEEKNAKVLEKVLEYLKGGGLVIIGQHFPAFVTDMDVFDKFFNEKLELPWRHGDLQRTSFMFNSGCALPKETFEDAMPDGPFSMKARQIRDARVEEKIFVPVPTGPRGSDSLDYDSEHTIDKFKGFPVGYMEQAQAAVACAKVGQGSLVYIGDTNKETDTYIIIMALLGYAR